MNKKLFFSLPIIGLFGYGLFFYARPSDPLAVGSKVDKIVVIKHKREMQLISGDSILKTYEISLGRSPKGPKEFEGDRKTPEGSYFIDGKNPNSGYHKNLGISYPNEQDRKHAVSLGKSPGGQIKIHGPKNGLGWIGRFHLLFDWTLGCIAVTDEDIDELYENIEIGTPIEVRP